MASRRPNSIEYKPTILSYHFLRSVVTPFSETHVSCVFPIVLLAGSIALASSGARAQTVEGDTTTEVTRRVYAGDKTPQEARRQAINEAKVEAVRQVVGTEVRGTRRSSTIERGEEVVQRFSQLVRTDASGRVIDSEVLEGNMIEENNTYFYRVRLRAVVAAEKGRSDQSFNVSLDLNTEDGVYVDRGALEDSDQLVAQIETTEDAYLTVFSITPDTLQVIWPNAVSDDTFAPAETLVEFPPPDLRETGALRFRVDVPEGRETVTNRLVVVATKDETTFQPVPEYELQGNEVTTTQASVEAMNRWLVSIPLDERALASATYDVTRVSAR